MSFLKQILSGVPRQRALVIGDVMLDEQIAGVAERISPEAPVPVIEATHSQYAPGGAANVAANLASLGAQVTLMGVVGSDRQSEILSSEIGDRGIRALFATDESRPTTTKTRVIAHGQQIVRIDRENRQPISAQVQQMLLDPLGGLLREVGVVVLSDYRKGVLVDDLVRGVIGHALSAGLPVLVDPKGADFRKYTGATVITPNSKEAFSALRHYEKQPVTAEEAGFMLLKMLPETAILITRGGEGMTLFESGAPPYHIAATAREVYDVTGAGDTAAGVLALCMAAGRGLRESASVANYAAGLVVAKFGTATITLDELDGYGSHIARHDAARG
jgi:rfaE bifunctional protein kinase chain/domain